MSTIITNEAIRFFTCHFVKGEHEDGCWPWIGSLTYEGYGIFSIGKQYENIIYLAHVISYAYYNNLKIINTCILHHCDIRKCVNPNHLFSGTPADNSADMVFKGRQAKGMTHGMAKLTDEDVIEIRRLHREGYLTQRQIANRFNVSQYIIYRIVNRLNWKHIP